MSRTRVFFVVDVHGSDLVFRKFLNAGKVYQANVIVLSGDITGKAIVPVVKIPDGTYDAYWGEHKVERVGQEQLESLKEKIESGGFYMHIADPVEIQELMNDQTKMDELFRRKIIERVKEWVSLAEKHLGNNKIKCFMSPGNDDSFEVDPILNGSSTVINPEGRVVDINGHEMITCGFSNITPWKCPRDVSEEELAQKLEAMIGQVESVANSIFNIHVPPIGSNLDECPKMDTSVYPPKPIVERGAVITFGAGSSAVRNAIEKYQPLLGLHGHIHEARGFSMIGRTLCMNPGSAYRQGIMQGAIVDLDEKNIKGRLFTTC